MSLEGFFWDVFQNYGCVDAYLGYNYCKKNDNSFDQNEIADVNIKDNKL